MAHYFHLNTEPGLWTVFVEGSNGESQSVSDHGNEQEAAAKVAMLNGCPTSASDADKALATVMEFSQAFSDFLPQLRKMEERVQRALELVQHGAFVSAVPLDKPHLLMFRLKDRLQLDRKQALVDHINDFVQAASPGSRTMVLDPVFGPVTVSEEDGNAQRH